MGKSLAEREEQKARESRLQQAIANDDVVEVHNLIVEERGLLDRVSKHPFPNTPLHLAAAAGKTQVAMEMAILKPSFARKLNLEGYSPMHLALQHEHYPTVRALMTIDPKLIRVRGQCGITPLHYVAKKEGDNELELLAEFLYACKSSIEDLTSRCETAVHVAVKNHNFKAFNVLFGWLKHVDHTEILAWKNEDGNTVLHIAVSEAQPEIIKLLIGHVKVDAKNFQGETALQIFQRNPSGGEDVAKSLRDEGHLAESFGPTLSLSQFFSREPTKIEKCVRLLRIENEYVRNTILVVATLIATTTYQAALSPPGGFWQDSTSNSQANSTVVTANSSSIALGKPHQAGNIILIGLPMYFFTICNTTAFFASICTIMATIYPLFSGPVLHIMMVASALLLLGDTYFFSLIMEFPKSNQLAVAVLAVIYLPMLSAAFILPRVLWVRHLRVVPRIDAIGGGVGNLL